MNTETVLLYLTAGLVGGVVNAAAGGAKLFVFPMLLAAGLPPVAANATGTVALWPALMPAIWVYRDRLKRSFRTLLLGAGPAVLGALAGASALIVSGDQGFMAVVPFFLIIAVVIITLGNRLATVGLKMGLSGSIAVTVLLFASGFYGGFFGAGLGFLLMAAFTLAGAADPQDANARKVLYATVINSTAVIPLAFASLVDWHAAAVVAMGGLAGGYAGAHLVRLLPPRPMRWAVAIAGSALTLYYLIS